LCGLPWGVFSTLAPAYASEMCPIILRGYLVTFVVLCWGIGQLIAEGVLQGLDTRPDQWAYRIPFAVQWVWPVVLFPIMCFAPESPWWLVRKGRLEKAEQTLKRLMAGGITDHGARQTVAMMVHTTRHEKSITAGANYRDCFRGSHLRRTEICCITWAAQVLSGWTIMSYAVYFYEQAGLQSADAFKMNVGQGGLHLLCTASSVFLTGNVGRRKIVLWGFAAMCSLMFLIGGLAFAPTSSQIGWAQSAIYLVWFCMYELTIGPVAYIYATETSSTRLRSLTVGLARNAYNIASIINYIVAPYLLNPTALNLKGKSALITGILCLIVFVWAFFRLPETKGRGYDDLDYLFEHRIPARKFKSTVVNPFASDNAVKVIKHHDQQSEA